MSTPNRLKIKLLGSACVAIYLGLVVYMYQDDAPQQASVNPEASLSSASAEKDEITPTSEQEAPSPLERAKTSFSQKHFDKTIELSGQIIADLESRDELASEQMMEAQLLNYKASFLKAFGTSSMHDIKRGSKVSFTHFNSLIKYACKSFNKHRCQQVRESVALFIYELPIFSRGNELSVKNIRKKDLRARYTQEVTHHTLVGRYKGANKSLQTIVGDQEYPLNEPVKVYYYLGREAAIKHRFNLAEEYLSKVIKTPVKGDAYALYKTMAADYLYHLMLRKKEMVSTDILWLSFADKVPTLLYQPDLVIDEQVDLTQLNREKIQLSVSVDKNGYVTRAALNQPNTASAKLTLSLIQEMLLKSRFSPIKDANGSLIASTLNLSVQLNPNLKKVLARKDTKLRRALTEFYPGGYRNSNLLRQSIHN